MSLTFPTGDTHSKAGDLAHTLTGHPHRAEPCRCGPRQLIDPLTDQCITCGHYEKKTITKTWHDRAQKVAGRR